MPNTPIRPSTLVFLNNLKANNNREWFNSNKHLYLKAQENAIDFAEELFALMQNQDDLETVSGRKSLHRIYRDIRFSKNKTPYKTNISGSFKRSSSFLRGGYYFHIEPQNTFIAGGFFGPNAEDLKHIRSHIAADDSELRTILNSKSFISNFGEMQGAQLKTAPKGYPKDHPAIDLLRYKQFVLKKQFSEDVLSGNELAKTMHEGFLKMRPFFDYMSEILTTDLNGSLLPSMEH